MALFSRKDRTFNLELERRGKEVIEQLHLAGSEIKRTPYASDHAAVDAYRQRVVEIIADGWELSLRDDDLGAPIACDPEQEARVSEPSDLGVYTDWLIEHGDPCGELAALRARAEREPSRELVDSISALEATRADDIFGIFARLPEKARVGLVWRHGWIEALEIATGSATVVACALAGPMMRFVTRLVFPQTHTPGIRSVIGTSPHRFRIKTLEIVSRAYAQELLDVLPELRDLRLPAGSSTSQGHPKVERIRLAMQSRGEVPDQILKGAWPKLQTVQLLGEAPTAALDAIASSLPDVQLIRQ